MISAFVICHNEEKNIGRCLESLKWCDEIVIVDSGSTDKTVDICKQYTTKIITNPWPGFVEQKQFALKQCCHEWVLNIDADEQISKELREEIVDVLSKHDPGTNGYYLSRVVYYLGRWWRRGGWYPEYRLRLCRRAYTTWGGDNPHEKALVDGKTQTLKSELYHFPYGNLEEQVRSLNSYSTISAKVLFERGERAGILNIVFRPVIRFIKFYFIRLGFLEGLPGLLVAVLDAYCVFLKYSKLWEMWGESDKSKV